MTRALRTWLLLGLSIFSAQSVIADDVSIGTSTRYVTVAGNKIAYRSAGVGPPLLILNRLRGTLDTWDPLFIKELARNRRIITVDYPGVGYSSGQLPADMQLVAAFVADFASSVGLKRFGLAGWSWGGAAAQAFAVAYPDRVARLVLIGTNPPGMNAAPTQPVWLERALKPYNNLEDEEILFFEPASARSRLAARESRERIWKAHPDVADRIPSSMESFAPFFTAIEGYRTDKEHRRDRLFSLPFPILVMCGTNDTSVPVQNWYPLIGKITRAQLIVLPESGHGPQHQYPKLAAAYIETFLDERSIQ